MALASQMRRGSQTEQAVGVLSQASALAASAKLTTLQTVADLRRVQTLRALDRADEAHKLLLTIPTPAQNDAPGLLCAYHRERGNFYAFIGNEVQSTKSFEIALKIAGERAPEEIVATLTSFGVSLWRLGLIDRAKMYFEPALHRTLRERHVWLLPRLYYLCTIAAFTMGDYARAREYVLNLKKYEDEGEMVPVLFTACALPIALRTGDHDLLGQCGPQSLMQCAIEDGNPTAISQLAAAFAHFEAHNGNERAARAVLRVAMPYVKTFAWNWDFLLAVARLGTRRDVERVRRVFVERFRFKRNDVPKAVSSLFDAFVAHREGRVTNARDFALQAAKRFTTLGWNAYAEEAAALCGKSRA